jgi:hypothetical protein
MPNTSRNGWSIVMKRARAGLGVTALIAPITRPAIAQPNTDRPFTIGVATGPALTSGETGFHASAAIDLRTPVSRVRLRAEGLHADWGGVGVTRFSSVLGSAILRPFPHATVSPYAIAGAGAYARFGDGMRAGWSIGVGARLPKTSHLLVESRVHAFTWNGSDLPLGHPGYTISDKWKYVWMPFSLAIRF